MAKATRFKTLLKRFVRHDKGNMAAMYAICAVPLMLAAGAAIDLARVSATKTHIQAALDAAALTAAAAPSASDAQRVLYGEQSFDANMKQGAGASLKPKANFTIEGKTVVATASVDIPTSMMSIVGITKIAAGGRAEVGIGTTKKAEIALVLDYSGSMNDKVGGEVKYVSMKKAAKKLVDDLSSSNPANIKFGLVPFSHHVYTTLPNAFVAGKGNSGMWTGCTQDRKYPFNLSDSTPISTNEDSKWGQKQAPEHADMGCKGYVTNNLRIMPLTNDFSSVNGQLDMMTPYAWTHIALGVEFGYQLLSNNAPFTEGTDYSDKGTRKFMVVLTDGMQTEPAFGPGGKRTVAQGEDNLEALCTSAKANGITIITMAFDLDDTGTRQRLQRCASDPVKNFFVVSDGSDLSAAFEAVRSEITQQVFLSK